MDEIIEWELADRQQAFDIVEVLMWTGRSHRSRPDGLSAGTF
jgi:hypothetical protein